MTPASAVRRLARRRVLLPAALAAVLAVAAVLGGGLVRGRAAASDLGFGEAGSRGGVLGIFVVPGWTATQHALQVGQLRRSYLVARPLRAGARGPLPVLVLLHGRGMTPALIARRSGMLGPRPAIVVLPAGYARTWNAGGCCGGARADGIDDVAFLNRLVRQVLHDQRDADPRAVYLAGFSNGGRMAYRMACQRPGLFSAVAAVEAVSVYPCSAVGVPVPLLVVASTEDPLLRIIPSAPPRRMEGYRQPSVRGVVAGWRALDGCTRAAPEVQLGALTQQRWTGCRGGVTVGLDLYAGGAHRWPAGGGAAPSATDEIWTFFGSRSAA